MTSRPNIGSSLWSAAHSAATRMVAPWWHKLLARISGGGWPLLSAVWPRVVVLFCALGLTKLALLAGLNKHLFETHWRTSSQPVTWLNSIAFGTFLGIGVLSLVALGQHCRSVGIKAVRTANAAVLGLGLLFIFLTFHAGDKNYLYPIMTGLLSWQSLGPYLSLELFFRPPFLAAWLFAYALIYYVLARTGREPMALFLTALFAGGYGLIHLRELLLCRQELLVADCLGVASLLVVWRPTRPLPLLCGLLPGAWTLFFWSLFRWASPDLRHLDSYFVLLLGESLVLFGGVTLLAKRQGFLAAWASLLPFYFAAFLLLTNVHYPTAINYNHLLCLGLGSPRYLVEEAVVTAAVALCGAWCWRKWPRTARWGMDLLNLSLIVVGLIDLQLSRIMGARLAWDVLAFGDSPKMMWRMARPYLPGALAGIGLIVLVYVLMLHGLQRWQRRRWTGSQPISSGSGLWFILASFLLLGTLSFVEVEPDKAEGQAGLRLALTHPLLQRTIHRSLSPEEFFRQSHVLGISDCGSSGRNMVSTQPPRDLNVLVIFQESSYNQHLSLFGGAEETQPLLSNYKDRMELFPNFFSNFAGSMHARFATFTSLYPVLDFNAFTLRHVGVKSLFEVLQEHGYTCSLFYSSFLDYTGFRDFLKGRGFDELYDADTMPSRPAKRVSWGLREEDTLEAIRNQIKKYAAGRQRFCLTYVPAAPHYPYDGIPKAFTKFKQVEFGDYTPLYLNELLYMDWVIASILDQLKESNLLDNTLVVITNDHGEMLGAKGGPIGHGWKLTPELVNTPLIIMDPQQRGYQLNYTIGSQVDLLPTVLDRLHLPIPANQLYEGRSLYAADNRGDRLIYLNCFQQFGVLSGNYLILANRPSDGDKAPLSKTTVYAISNQGSKTFFTETSGVPVPKVSIRDFDEFQENLMQNYSLYSKAISKTQ